MGGAATPAAASPPGRPSPVSPPGSPGPAEEARRHEILGRRADQVLVRGGVNPSDVYGGERPDTPGRVRLARSLLENPFSRRVRDRMLPWALRFAADHDGRRDPAGFTRRYEYAKAVYDSEKREVWLALNNGTMRLERGQSIVTVAADRAAARNLHAQFDADTRIARRLSGEPAVVNPNTAPDAVARAVRGQADYVGFTDEVAAAYHARKHHREVPEAERTDDVVTGYYSSARRTIQEGVFTSAERIEQGRTKVTFHRTATESNGNEVPLEAIVYVRASGLMALATYGRPKEAKNR